MNRERAELHLRLLAENGLRQTMTRPASSPAGQSPDQRTYSGLALVARALTTVHAVDAGIAEHIQADFDLALIVRRPGGLGQVNPGPRGPWRHRSRLIRQPPAGAPKLSCPPQPPASAPWRVVPVGHVIRVGDDDAAGELCLLAFAQTADGARFTVASWMDVPEAGGPVPPPGQSPRPHVPLFDLLSHLTATDNQGVGYHLGFSGGGSNRRGRAEWEGVLELHPSPPHQIRWLDLSAPGGLVARLDLDPPVPPPDITVTKTALTPGEVLLDKVAAGLLAREPAVAPDGQHSLDAAGGPGGIVTALRAADALPPSSPVPGQLAWLCATLAGSGFAAPPAGVPEPWLSMLAHHQRRLRPAPASPGPAAVAVELPELDGARIALLGLYRGSESTIAHLLATGIALDENWLDIMGTGPIPALWLRDHRDQWHTTRMKGFSSADSGEVMLQLAIEPPVDRGTPWLELRAAGQLAEVRVKLPLHWT